MKLLYPLRNKWVRLPLIAWSVYLVFAAAVLAGSRYRTRQKGRKEVEAVVAKLDAETPGWKWQDIEAARGPDASSPGSISARFHASLTQSDREEIDNLILFVGQFEPANLRASNFWADEVEDLLSESKPLAIAREFQTGVSPQPPPILSRDLIFSRIPNTVDLGRAVILLGLDAEQCCRQEDANSAIVRLRSMINAERSIGTEPFAASQNIRMVAASRTAWQTERVLAQSQPTTGLAELQAALLAEARVDFALYICRAERALLHELFLRLEAGTVEFEPLCKKLTYGRYGFKRDDYETVEVFENFWWLYKKYLPHNHAEALECLTRGTAECARPESEHPQAVAELHSVMQASRDNFFARGLLNPPESALTRQMKTRARLRCAATAIALERYRQKFGHWPATLEEIPKEILPEVPIDPFAGKPLKYEPTDEGVQVYSIQASVVDASDRHDPGVGFGSLPDFRCRLFDPQRRGVDPPPVPFDAFHDFELDGPGRLNHFRRPKDAPELEPGPPPRIVREAK